MPTYLYRCPEGHISEDFKPMSQHCSIMQCQQCGMSACQVITAPLLVKAAPDVSYDSPIDGRPITSMQARQEDLKRSGCTPYDPAQKQDYDRRVTESEQELDRDIEATVEEAVTKMDGDSRRRLASELLDQGVTTDTVRTTPHA